MTYPSGPEGSATPADQPPIYVPPQAPSPATTPVPPVPAAAPVPPAPIVTPGTEQPPAPAYPSAATEYPSVPGYPTPPVSAPVYPPTSTTPVPGALPTPMPPGGYPPTQPAPPTYDPALAAQLSVGLPHPYGLAPAPAPKKTGMIVLSALLGLFVLVSGVVGGLYVTKSQQASDLSRQLNTTTADRDNLRKDLDQAQRDLQDSDDEVKDMTTERDAIADCLNAIYAWWEALDGTNNQDTPATEALRQKASQLCQDADKYL